GKQIAQYGGQGKAAGHFLTLGAIALDPLGNVWAAERGGNRVQELNPVTGKAIAVFGQRGTDPGQFVHPNGIGIGCDGLLTVSDTGANRVQTFQLAAPPATTACAPLPPVASTPGLQSPKGPPDPAVQLIFQLVHKLGVLRSGGFTATTRCDQSCTLSVTGTLTPLAPPRKHHK